MLLSGFGFTHATTECTVLKTVLSRRLKTTPTADDKIHAEFASLTETIQQFSLLKLQTSGDNVHERKQRRVKPQNN